MKREDLKEILERHQKWLKDEVEGKRAYLSGADLSGTDLIGANLIGADLSGANLSGSYLRRVNLSSADLIGVNLSSADLSRADLSRANLIGANLSRANLSRADLSRADLSRADLSRANLSGAGLSGADLSRAKITNVIYDYSTSFFSLQCPEKGSFIGYKKCANNLIVELEILSDSKRSSATSRKCRCEKAKVLAIYNVDKTPSEKNIACSLRNDTFYYEINQIVIVNNFDENRWNECSTGIHFFLTFDEAKYYE